MRFGFIDIRNERWIDALPELWRLLTRKPPRSKPWRDFWKLWLPAFAIVFGVFAILDLSPFSPLGFVLLIALAVGVSYVTGVLFRRLGVIGDYRTRR